MILHCVFCNIRSDVTPARSEAVLQGLAEFAKGMDGVQTFDHGPNLDFEAKTPQYAVGFVIRFADKASVEAYANHPTHQALGGQLCDLCVGGADGITVFDLKV